MYRRADPSFTNWVPKTAYEAVDRFTRCQSNGLKALMFPECLIECSKGLPDAELDKFEDWIINPQGLDYSKAVPDDSIRAQCAATFQAAVGNHNRVPPLPPVDEDEKMHLGESSAQSPRLQDAFDAPEEKEEKEDVVMKVQELGDGEVLIGPVTSEMAAMAVCGLL